MSFSEINLEACQKGLIDVLEELGAGISSLVVGDVHLGAASEEELAAHLELGVKARAFAGNESANRVLEAVREMDGMRIWSASVEALTNRKMLVPKDNLELAMSEVLMATLEFGLALMRQDKTAIMASLVHLLNADCRIAKEKGDREFLSGRYGVKRNRADVIARVFPNGM